MAVDGLASLQSDLSIEGRSYAFLRAGMVGPFLAGVRGSKPAPLIPLIVRCKTGLEASIVGRRSLDLRFFVGGPGLAAWLARGWDSRRWPDGHSAIHF